MADKKRAKTVNDEQESAIGYEDMLSVLQDMTFQDAESCFGMHGQTLNPDVMKRLCITENNGRFTNLALLLSDQCMHSIKLTVFRGTGNAVLQERVELHGSLLSQLKDAYAFLDRLNQKQIAFCGLSQVEQRSYPEEAVREGLVNAMLHRDYRFKDATLINIYDDRIEFVTLGGLIDGITVSDLKLGISVLRNPKLVYVFSELQLIGAYGTGIAAINESYSGQYRTPQIESSEHAFRLTLPNRNYKAERPFTHLSPPYRKQEDDREKQILDLTRSKGYISRKDIETALHVSQSMAILILRKMTEKGLLIKEGAGKNRLYWAR